jgi:hypothetical protein
MRLTPLLFLSLAALLTGCGHRGGTVDFDVVGQNQRLSQYFGRAFVTQNKTGEYDIVLVDSDEKDLPKPRKRGPLPQVPIATVRQAMHIHVYWKPMLGTTKNPAAINSSITWYVLGPDGSNSMMTYEGAGYVVVRSGKEERTIQVRDGQIEIRSKSPDMTDPIGLARISGEALAIVSEARVKETLADIEGWKKQVQASARE